MADKKKEEKTQDSSLFLGLAAIQQLEADRVTDEKAEKARRIREEAVATAEAARLAREAEEAQARADKAKKEAEAAAERAETARLEALKLATIEEARVKAEHAGRLEKIKAEGEHELKLTQVRESSGKQKFKRIAIFAGVVLVAGGIGTTIVIQRQAEEAQRKLKEKDQAIAALEGEIKTHKDELDALQARLKATNDDAERERIQAEIKKKEDDIRKKKQAQADMGGGGGGYVAQPQQPAAPKKLVCRIVTNRAIVARCEDGDTLCSCAME